jgi:hypothetical protein
VTITNPGEQGVGVGYGIVHPPQVALEARNFVIALHPEFGVENPETDCANSARWTASWCILARTSQTIRPDTEVPEIRHYF